MKKKNKINSLIITTKSKLELDSSLNEVLGIEFGKILNINIVPVYTKTLKIIEYITTITFETENNKQ